MYIIKNVSNRDISLSDLKITVKSGQKTDLDELFSRYVIEKSNSLSIGINKGFLKIIRKDDISSISIPKEDKKENDITKEYLQEMENRISNLVISKSTSNPSDINVNSLAEKLINILGNKENKVENYDYEDPENIVDIHTKSLDRMNKEVDGMISHKEEILEKDIQKNIDELDGLL